MLISKFCSPFEAGIEFIINPIALSEGQTEPDDLGFL